MSNGNDTKELAPYAPAAVGTADYFNTEQLDLIKRTVAPKATADELKLFLYQCARTGLDPLSKQIYAISRKQWDDQANGYINKMTIQTGIDGLRLIADRTGRYSPGRDTEFAYDGNGKLLKATAHVRKRTTDGQWHEISATAFYDEYVGLTNAGKPTKMWAEKPHIMLSKCAEALALRRAFPAEMSGLYTGDEMRDEEAPPAPQYIPPPETQAKLAAVSAASREASKGFVDGSARAHREAPGHGPKAQGTAPSAGSSSSQSSTSPAPSAPTSSSSAPPVADPAAPVAQKTEEAPGQSPKSAKTAASPSNGSAPAAAGGDLPKGGGHSSGGAERAVVSGAIGSPPAGVSSASSPASSGDLPKEATAPSATPPSSTPSGAQDAPCLFETPIGMVVKEGVLADPNKDGVWGRGAKPDSGDFVWSVTRNAQTKAVSWCGWEPRRNDGQSKRMFQLFNQRGIKEEDSQNGVQNKPVEGWRSRLRKRYLKESTKDLSERECDHLIKFLERMNEQHGDLADRRQRMADSGLQQRQDGSWGDGGAA